MRRPLTIAALVLVPLALYARTLTFDFVQADDVDLIRGNASFLQHLGNVPEAFERSYFDIERQPSGHKTYYRPLVIVSFMVDAQVRGADPHVYHLTNVLIHIVAVVWLFTLLKSLGTGEAPALALALLFAVHPANVQAVAWIPGRNDTLMAALALVSLITFHRHQRTPGPSWRVLHVAAFGGALFTKESALALPVILVPWGALSPDGRRRRRAPVALIAADVVVVAGWYVLRRAALAGGVDEMGARAYLTTVVANAQDLLLYAGKIVLPVHLSVMPGLTRLDVALGVAALALLAWLLTQLAPRWRWLVTGWVLLFLIPALLIPGLPAYEHRLYFPLMAIIVGISQLSVWSAASRARRRAITIVATVAAVLAALSFAHLEVFRDRYAYWTSATRGTPYSGLAHVNLGQIYESDGDEARAAEHYRQALLADPMTPGAHNNLGVLAARRGDVEEARVQFRREVERHPANADAFFNLGLLDKLSNRADDAAAWWERAVAADPGHAAAHDELAAYFAAKGDAARAARHRDAAKQ